MKKSRRTRLPGNRRTATRGWNGTSSARNWVGSWRGEVFHTPPLPQSSLKSGRNYRRRTMGENKNRGTNMKPEMLPYVIAVLALAVGLIVGYIVSKAQTSIKQRQQKLHADKVIQEAKDQARNI